MVSLQRLFLCLILCCALVSGASASTDRVFYQPQSRDAQLTLSQWHTLFSRVRQQGYVEVVVQWTRWGEQDFGGPHGWLAQALQQAKTQGLRLKLGLYADPDYFQWIGLSDEVLDAHLKTYVRQSLQTAVTWQDSGLAGSWYLPAELDDLNWQDVAKRTRLMQALQQIKHGLPARTIAPSISVFITGHSAPDELQLWYRQLAEQGWAVWLQDGSGTTALQASQRALYRAQLLPCPSGHQAPSLVLEAFRQTNPSRQPFRARPATPPEWQAQLRAAQAACPTQTAVFSLRYLPLSRRLLAY